MSKGIKATEEKLEKIVKEAEPIVPRENALKVNRNYPIEQEKPYELSTAPSYSEW